MQSENWRVIDAIDTLTIKPQQVGSPVLVVHKIQVNGRYLAAVLLCTNHLYVTMPITTGPQSGVHRRGGSGRGQGKGVLREMRAYTQH